MLQVTPVETVAERCQRVRLTGQLVLRNGAHEAEVLWLGGQPAEPEAAEELGRWREGEFEVVQRMPDLQGQLTDGVELSGELSLGQVQRIAQLCSDFRLSADLLLERSTGDRAQVRFTHGKVESAAIGGQPQMALQALSLLAVWHRGRYQVRLRPLFGDDAPEAPIFVEKETTKGDFDVTGTIQLPLVEGERRRGAAGAPASQTTPRGQPTQLLAAGPASPSAQSPAGQASRPPQRQSQQSPPVAGEERTLVPEVTRPAVAMPTARPVWARALLVGLVGGGLAFSGVIGGRLWLRQRAERALRAPSLAPARMPLDLAPSPDLAPAAAVLAPGDLAPPPVDPPRRQRPPQQQAQLERALRMVVEGRLRRAQEVVGQLRQQAPDDPEIQLVERQVRGELGRAEIVVTGTGTATINGHAYAAPYRLRVPAGLYLVNGEPLQLADGERRQVPARIGR